MYDVSTILVHILLLFVLLMVGGLQVFNSKYKSEICY